MPYGDQDIGPLLEALGYTHISGWGPSAVWEQREPVLDANGDPTYDSTGQANYTVKGRYLQRTLANGYLDVESPYYTAPASATAVGGMPGVTRDANGVYHDASGRALSQADLDAMDAAAVARGRAPTQPLAPHFYTDRNGDIVGLNPTTLVEIVRIPGAQWPTLSPDQQRAIQQGDLTAARAYTTGERIAGEQARAGEAAAGREFSASEAATGRAFSANESAQARAERVAEFAASQAQSERGLQFNVEQANRQGFAQASRDRLAAAQQYANLVSATDTAALPAYLNTGGGVLWNARQVQQQGQTPSLLTENAINPAASSLREARAPSWTPITLPALQGFQQPTYQQWQEPRVQQWQEPVSRQSIPGNQPSGFNPNNPNTTWMGPVPAGTAGMSAGALPMAGSEAGGFYSPSAIAARVAESRAAGSGAGGGGFAGGTGGGFVQAPQQFWTGEQGPELQQVYDPPGADNAMIRVVPNQGFAGGTPGYALGTSADPTGMGFDPSGLDPYAQEVRQFRQGFRGPQLQYGQFDPRFSRTYSPQTRQSYFMGQQTQSGVPAEALSWEAQRFTPRGFSRNALGLGY